MKKVCRAVIALTAAAAVLPSASISVFADNPVVQTRYTADPAPMVSADGETLYLFTSHDELGGGEDGAMYVMNDWNLYSTQDMVNWTDLGVPAGYDIFKWSGGDAWAIQTVCGFDGKYYLYAPVTGEASTTAIGVGVADRPEGPYTDAIGRPLTQKFSFIDPSVYVDEESERAFIVWGNPDPYFAELNTDMISFKTKPVRINKTKKAFGSSTAEDRETRYEEGPWIYKRSGNWYLVYAGNGIPEDLEYSICDNETFLNWVETLEKEDGTTDYSNSATEYSAVDGPWEYGNVLMSTFDSGTFTNHPGPIDFKNNSYLFYHTAKLPGANGFRRSVAVDEMKYNADGSIVEVEPTTGGTAAIATLNPYKRVEAETIAFSEGLKTDEYYTVTATGEKTDTFTNNDTKNVFVTGVENGDYIKVREVNFGEKGAGIFKASVACAKDGGSIEIHLDSKNGTLVGELPVSYTGGEETWQEKTAAVSGTVGKHDVYFVFKGETNTENLFNFDYWQFTEKTDEKTLAAINAVTEYSKIDIKDGTNTTGIKVTAVYSDGTSEDVTSSTTVTAEPNNATYKNGVITGTAYGETTLTVSYGGVNEKIKLNVKDMDTELTVTKLTADCDSVKLVYGGTGTAVEITAEYADGHTENVTDKAKYTSANTAIATVTDDGTISPVKVGKTTVKASFAGRMGKVAEISIPVKVTSNVIENGDMENGTEGWSTQGTATLTSVTAEKAGGEYSLLVSGRGDTGSGAKQLLTGKIQPGKTYKISAKVKYTEGVDEREFSITLHNDDWSALKSESDKSWDSDIGFHNLAQGKVKKGEWTTLETTFTVPEDATLSFPAIFVETTWVAAPTSENDLMNYYLDDVTLADINAGDEADEITTVSTAKRVGSNIVLTTTASEIIKDKVLHIALYDKNDVLIRYMQIPTSASEKTAYVVFEDNASAEYAKVFVWDTVDQMIPVANAEKAEIK